MVLEGLTPAHGNPTRKRGICLGFLAYASAYLTNLSLTLECMNNRR